jgi:hypothetical protein
MLKELIVATAMLSAAPVLAQDKADSAAATPSTATPGAPKATPPQQSAEAAAPDAAKGSGGGGATKKQAPPEQVASIVGREFGVYDVNHNGVLEKEEFAAWMVALKTSAPGATPADAPSPKWSEAAFKQADPDKSKTVTHGELLAFFTGNKADATS